MSRDGWAAPESMSHKGTPNRQRAAIVERRRTQLNETSSMISGKDAARDPIET